MQCRCLWQVSQVRPMKSDIRNYHSCKYLLKQAPKSAAFYKTCKIIFSSKTILPKEELVGSDNSYIQLSLVRHTRLERQVRHVRGVRQARLVRQVEHQKFGLLGK
jgi:hypothetical protein